MNKRTKKIIAGVGGGIFIVLLLLFANSLVGNPISKAMVKTTVQQYVAENYNNLDLELSDPIYNFKLGTYDVVVKSKNSEDTVFTISAESSGNIKQDDYEYEVANCFTTSRRLSSELDEKAEELISGKMDYDFDYMSISFIQEIKGDSWLSKLNLDMKVDIQNPPIPLEADICIFSNDMSWNKIAEIALGLESILKEQNVPISQYSVRLIPMADKPQKEGEAVSWENSLSLSYFPAEMMKEEDLPEVMKQFEEDRIAALEKIGKERSDD